MKLEGKRFVSSIELLAWAKANGCPWDYNTRCNHPWTQLFSSVHTGGRPCYRSYYIGTKYLERMTEPTPSKAGRVLRSSTQPTLHSRNRVSAFV